MSTQQAVDNEEIKDSLPEGEEQAPESPTEPNAEVELLPLEQIQDPQET